MAYSLDFRKQVFKVKEKNNFTFEETSKHFGITIRSLFRWKKNLEPKLKRDKPASKVDMKRLENDVKKNPDSYQYERAEKFSVTQSTIYYALKRLGISVIKNVSSPKSKRRKKVGVSKKNKAV
jgi:transposase